MQLLPTLRRGLPIALLLILLALAATPFAAAQSDPAHQVEERALAAHLQNLRLHSYTAWIGGSLGAPENAPRRSALIERLDDWVLPGFAGDEDVTLADLERPVLLNFWASWCPPCRAEFPHLVAVATTPEDHAFDVVFVNTSDTERDARAYLADFPEDITTTIDENEQLALHTSIESIPTSLLVDTDGTVLAVHIGAMTPTVSAFMDAVAANPGAGTFVAANHMDTIPGATLAPVNVDEADSLTPGETVSGALDDEQFQHAYRIAGRAGDLLAVTMEADAGDLDPYLVLLDADGARLAENDDIERGTNTDARVSMTLPADGAYLVVATRFLEAEGFSSGRYMLTAELITPEASDPGAADSSSNTSPARPGDTAADGWRQRDDAGFLIYNTTTSGEVSGTNPRALYAFEAQAGDVISVHVTQDASATPLRIEIKDPRQRALVTSDPARDGTATLHAVALPEAGIYRVTVFRARSDDSTPQPFAITLLLDAGALPANAPPHPNTGEDDPDTAPVATPGSTPSSAPDNTPDDAPDDNHTLNYNQTVQGVITDNSFAQQWTFKGTAGDVIDIEMQRMVDEDGGLDGFLVLEGPDGQPRLEVDDAHDSVMPAIENYELPASGIYTITATRFGFANGFSTGAYSLTLTQRGSVQAATGPSPDWLGSETLPGDLRWIGYNETAQGRINAENVDDWYSFQGSAGDLLVIRMAADDGDLDTFLILTDSHGVELARNDDSGDPGAAPHDAAIEFTLPASGTYLIRATRYGFANGPTRGTYQLTIVTDAAAPETATTTTALVYGDTAEGTLDFDQPVSRYTFQGQAGDAISVRAAGTGGLLPALVLRDPSGTVIAEAGPPVEAGGTAPARDEAALLRFPLPASGSYTLEVMPQDLNTAGAYLLLLLGQPAAPVDTGAFQPTPGLDLELVLIWSPGVDLDLQFAHADGTPVAAALETTRANDYCQETSDTAIERVAWPREAQPGVYDTVITYRNNCTAQTDPVPFILVIARNGEVIDMLGGTLARTGDRYSTPVRYTRE